MTIESLRRYTSLPVLLDILNKKSLTLLDPQSWDDKNDSYFIELYKKAFHFDTVLALCFVESSEKYHHWKIFSGSSCGVCVEFNKDKLLNYFKTSKGFRSDKVEYKTIQELETNNLDNHQLPFIKRVAFEDENEFRILYQCETGETLFKMVRIDLDCISKIIINPWISKPVYNSIRAVIKLIDGCNEIPIMKTGLTNNDDWKKLGDKMLNPLELNKDVNQI
jgi:hypothetical protein